MDGEVVAGARFGRLMGRLSDRDGFQTPKDSMESWCVDELHLLVTRYDQLSTRQESQRVRLGVGRRDYQGTDVVDFDTALSFEEHCKFVSAFITSVKPQA